MDKSQAVRALVKAAPVLTAEQEARLRALLASKQQQTSTIPNPPL